MYVRKEIKLLAYINFPLFYREGLISIILFIFFLRLFFKVLYLKIILRGLPSLGSWPNSSMLFELIPLEPTLILVWRLNELELAPPTWSRSDSSIGVGESLSAHISRWRGLFGLTAQLHLSWSSRTRPITVG